MLVGKGHAGGKRSLVVEDGTFLEKNCRSMISAHEKHVFCTEWVPICPIATKNAANYMSARRRPFFLGVLGSEIHDRE